MRNRKSTNAPASTRTGCSLGSARERFRSRRPRRRGSRASSAQTRRDLLLKWLPFAQFVDVELRSLYELREVWDEAARLKIKRICSIHDFARTPPHALLQKQFQRAKKAGTDVFKLVTRADTSDDLLALLQFLRRAGDSGSRGRSPSPRQAGAGIECSVMATGRFGPFSRYLFAECGSVFVYAALRRPLYAGQVTLEQLRSRRSKGLKKKSSRAQACSGRNRIGRAIPSNAP
jgi:3-dehydroquinate dehydratase type I